MVEKEVDIMTSDSSEWGVVRFDDIVATQIKKADYSALIKRAKVIIKPENIWLIVEFETIEHEVFAGFMPDAYFLLLYPTFPTYWGGRCGPDWAPQYSGNAVYSKRK